MSSYLHGFMALSIVGLTAPLFAQTAPPVAPPMTELTGVAAKLTDWLLNQGPFAVLLVLAWWLYIKPRLDADVARVSREAEANVKRAEQEAAAAAKNADSLRNIADTMQALAEANQHHELEVRRIGSHIVSALMAHKDNRPEQFSQDLAALKALLNL